MTAAIPNPSSSEILYEGELRTDNGKVVQVGVYNPEQYITSDKFGEICVPFLDDRALDFLAAQIKEMIHDKYDCVVMITGRRRIGKSNLGLQIARRVDPGFTLESVAFHVDDFSALINKNPDANPEAGLFPQDFYDEAGFGLFAKDWMREWVIDIGKCLQVVGKKRHIVYFILPHIRKLVGDIRDEMAYIWIDVDWGYKHQRGYAEVYMGDRNKHKQLIWWKPKCCFKYGELQDDFWHEYEKRKDAFIAEVASGKHDSKNKSKDSDRLNRALYDLHRTGVSIPELCERFNLGQAMVYRRIAEHKSTVENGSPKGSGALAGAGCPTFVRCFRSGDGALQKLQPLEPD